MGTTKRRQSKRNNSRQAAVSFLSNITLGNEHEIKSSSTTTITESPNTSATQYGLNNIPTVVAGRPILTRYGTLSVSNDTTAKGVSFDSSDSNSTFDEHVPIKLTIDTSHRRSNSGTTIEPLSANTISTPITGTETRKLRRESTSESFNLNSTHRRFSSGSSTSSEFVHQYKLTREDSERPIASEKIKKKLDHQDKNSETGPMSFMSVLRYYKGIIRQPRRRSENYLHHTNHSHHLHYQSYFHQHLSNMHLKHRKALSYGHFLSSPSEQLVPNSSSSSSDETATAVINLNRSSIVTTGEQPSSSYDPNYLDDDTTFEVPHYMMSSHQGSIGDINIIRAPNMNKKKELNQVFRKNHPEIPPEITLSKINSIKSHLLNIGKSMDLELSSVSHAFVYFEKLIQKNIVNKKNRKLLAACCLFLATKVNEPRGSWFKSLLEAIHSELNVNSKDVRDHEFAVFADLEFNLYVPLHEFMPHFDRITRALEIQCIEDYLGNELFYKTMDGGHEIVGAANTSAFVSV